MNASFVAIVGFECLPKSGDEGLPIAVEKPEPAEGTPTTEEQKPRLWGAVLMPWISPIPGVFSFLLSAELFFSPLEHLTSVV